MFGGLSGAGADHAASRHGTSRGAFRFGGGRAHNAGDTRRMTNRRQGKPTPLGDALRRYLAKAGLGRRLAQAQVIPDWPRLVGPQIAAVTQPESVTPDGTLFVRVATSAWMNELQLMGPQIMTAVNAGAAPRIKTIRWLLSR